ncbi:endonuclease domain-containing protein [Streptacidiphilus sp. PB12-B1b]|uniref:endonuclease domain-containing protein n=1 Tax=Streptacidiphilus sp. PB12-B1b TaxID=2705012 RepID=UPI00351A7A61
MLSGRAANLPRTAFAGLSTRRPRRPRRSCSGHVDHDRKTGRVRAILCSNCDGGPGQFKDRPELLRRGADYLEGNVWKPTLVAPGVYRLPS